MTSKALWSEKTVYFTHIRFSKIVKEDLVFIFHLSEIINAKFI